MHAPDDYDLNDALDVIEQFAFDPEGIEPEDVIDAAVFADLYVGTAEPDHPAGCRCGDCVEIIRKW